MKKKVFKELLWYEEKKYIIAVVIYISFSILKNILKDEDDKKVYKKWLIIVMKRNFCAHKNRSSIHWIRMINFKLHPGFFMHLIKRIGMYLERISTAWFIAFLLADHFFIWWAQNLIIKLDKNFCSRRSKLYREKSRNDSV